MKTATSWVYLGEAMNILMSYDNVDPTVFDDKDAISSFDILSQIVPPLSLQYKTKHFGDDEDYEKSNHVLEITNGKMKRGQLEKSALGSRSKGILQRVCNDFGNDACSKFIDDLQNIATYLFEWLSKFMLVQGRIESWLVIIDFKDIYLS